MLYLFQDLLASEKKLEEYLPDEFDETFMEQKEFINYVKGLPNSTDVESEIFKLETRIEICRTFLCVRCHRLSLQLQRYED